MTTEDADLKLARGLARCADSNCRCEHAPRIAAALRSARADGIEAAAKYARLCAFGSREALKSVTNWELALQLRARAEEAEHIAEKLIPALTPASPSVDPAQAEKDRVLGANLRSLLFGGGSVDIYHDGVGVYTLNLNHVAQPEFATLDECLAAAAGGGR